MAQLKNTNIDDTQFFTVATGTTAQRPVSPSAGTLRFNTTTSIVEYFTGTYWSRIDHEVVATSVGAAVVADVIDDGIPYRVHVFNGSGSFTPTYGGEVEYLIVGGGGGGGAWVGGGGGGGGVLKGTITVTPQTYTVVVGGGGTAEFNPGSYGGMPRGTNGGSSSVFGFTAIGGGRGGSWDFAPTSGSSGGGGGQSNFGTGTTGQGNAGGTGRFSAENGYPTGGGGGAGNIGQNWSTTKSGDGGIGIISTITGIPTYYGGGGGGGIHGNVTASNAIPGRGGLGGGGHGDGPSVDSGFLNPNNSSRIYAGGTSPTGRNGSSNTGGGGGGSGSRGDAQSAGGTGGSGIVVIRYKVRSSYREIQDPVNFSTYLNLDAANPASYDYGADAGNFGGRIWYDTAYGRNGTLINVPEFNNLGGGAINLTAPQDRYVTVPHDAIIESRIFSSRFFATLECWVNTRTFQNWTSLIMKANNGADGSYSCTTGIGLWSNIGGYQLVVGSGENGNPAGSVIVLSFTAVTNRWYHVVGVVDGVDAILYVDGVEITKTALTNVTRTVNTGTNVITLGRRATTAGPALEGWISVARAYDYPLSLGAIRQNFESGRGRYGV